MVPKWPGPKARQRFIDFLAEEIVNDVDGLIAINIAEHPHNGPYPIAYAEMWNGVLIPIKVLCNMGAIRGYQADYPNEDPAIVVVEASNSNHEIRARLIDAITRKCGNRRKR